VLFYLNQARKGKQGADGGKVKDADVKFYQEQKVRFFNGDASYIPTMKRELDEDLPHFEYLRQESSTHAVKNLDFIGIKIEDQTWLFPVSQKYLKDLYSMVNLDGKMEAIPFSHAVGYAPEGMPFIPSTEHWKDLRKSVAAIFHSDFMETYLANFNKAVRDLVVEWKDKSGKTINIKSDICKMAYDSAVYALIGSKLDVEVPYHQENGEDKIHIRDHNAKFLNDFTKHAATKEFVKNNDYRLGAGGKSIENLNLNMGTLAGALTGLVNARVAEIQGGAPGKTTIVDAAISLVLKGIIKNVDEAVQHGWAILNGAHLNCGNILSATLYYLMKNPKKLEILRNEIQKELLKDGKWDENNLHELLTRENLKDLEYLSYVVKEGLRLSSPIYGKAMKAKEDINLDGFTVKKGTIIYPNNAVIGVSYNIWKDPLEFIPERFDPENEYFKLPDGKKREPIAWLAFGAGPRACMGDNYSMYFVKVGLVYFLHLFNFELKEEPKEDSFFYWLNDRNYTAKVSKN